LAGDDVLVFIDSWPLIGLKIMLATNQISRIYKHRNLVDFTKGSPNVSKGEVLAEEDARHGAQCDCPVNIMGRIHKRLIKLVSE
jgi:hypothetical protein